MNELEFVVKNKPDKKFPASKIHNNEIIDLTGVNENAD